MNCMKCGVEIEPGQAFCSRCLEDMEKYPVRPNVMVHLPPPRENTVARRQTARKVPPTRKDWLRRMKIRVRILTVLLLLSLAALAALSGFTWMLMKQKDKPLVGQNYSTVTTPTEETKTDVSRETSPEES